MIKRVYVAGPYSATDRWIEECNVRAAECMGHLIAQVGAYPVIPHANTRPYFSSCQTPEFWYRATLENLATCHALILIGDWKNSRGAMAEKIEAERLGLPVFYISSALINWIIGAE